MKILSVTSIRNVLGLAIGAAGLLAAPAAHATLSFGPGGQGVTGNASSLIGAGLYDYVDTITGTSAGGVNPNRPYIAALQPSPAYVVEQTFGHPSVNFQTAGQPIGVAAWSIAADNQGHVLPEVPVYPGSSGAGSATGFTQTGGGVDYGVPYGFRTRYVVQADAVTSADRIDIGTGNAPGTIGTGNVTVFFRGLTGGVSLYDGAVDTPVPGYDTGLRVAGQWHNYAALWDQTAKTVQLFVDEQSKGVIDLNTLAGGRYANFSNAFVGVGAGLAGGENRTWTDNFQVGAPAVPEPSSIALVGGLVALVGRRRRR
jgi:hypothetical protein